MSIPGSKFVRYVASSPFILGALAAAGFYALIYNNTLSHPWVVRYFASHPVEYITATMFFVALASLLVKAVAAMRERSYLRHVTIGEIPEGGQPIEKCKELLDDLDSLSPGLQTSYLGRRLRNALEFVRRTQAADGLTHRLKELAETDLDRQHNNFALERFITWAIPILGFLGTVMGITLAIANLGSVSGSLLGAVPLVVSGLSVAFDTTALALSLTLILMFIQFVVDRMETWLLENVEDRAALEMVGRFQTVGASNDPHLSAVRRTIDAVLATTEGLVKEQAKLWTATIDSAHGRWNELVNVQQEQLENSLANAIGQQLKEHAAQLAVNEEQAAKLHQETWKGMQASMENAVDALTANQQEHTKQGQVLLQVVEATGQVTKLEDALNRNLSSLSKAASFEETLLTLTAILNVMTTRMGVSDEHLKQIQLKSSRPEGEAA